ncbi:cytochrome b/b6 domain-containing protein [Palleronia sp. LCG004]|uniref:cytochrome b/b6 domain-containing protein n=1 Tax=Palleronia sp. LCG004 TaxID=3079304 RepID=UPI00294315A4|nr:cytochrome b/b6 domain-containing protein [Palleronia sp. LCG004]WOI55025.1 cytochrome b/b6 domain-containing protein [Palleronia sp. LCG004]
MQLRNSGNAYGTVSKTFHWLTALLILTAIPLGLIGEDLPQDTSAEVARKALVFSIHKTIGVTIFFVALLRILWALTEAKPDPVHADRRAETFLAEAVHWSLYAALVVVPLSGWIGHAAAEGFAPIYWPFGQSLPLVPKSTAVEHLAFTTHWVFTKVLIGALILHVAGAVKHALLDRDGTVSRMWFGAGGPARPSHGEHPGAAILLAAAVYVFGGVAVLALSYEGTTQSTGAIGGTGDWQVEDGRIDIVVRQMGAEIEGRFADWSADIAFSEDPSDGRYGEVTVNVDIPSLTLGSVTSQALGENYFDAENHPTATFDALILPADDGYLADGTLSLAGETADVSFPFTLDIDGDTARMEGQVTLDRRDFAIGEGQTNPDTLGFDVVVDIALTAIRQ